MTFLFELEHKDEDHFAGRGNYVFSPVGHSDFEPKLLFDFYMVEHQSSGNIIDYKHPNPEVLQDYQKKFVSVQIVHDGQVRININVKSQA